MGQRAREVHALTTDDGLPSRHEQSAIVKGRQNGFIAIGGDQLALGELLNEPNEGLIYVRIVDATGMPLLVDIDTGWGGAFTAAGAGGAGEGGTSFSCATCCGVGACIL